MIPSELVQGHDMLNSLQGQTSMPKLRVNNEKWLSKPGKVRDRNSNNDWSMWDFDVDLPTSMVSHLFGFDTLGIIIGKGSQLQ